MELKISWETLGPLRNPLFIAWSGLVVVAKASSEIGFPEWWSYIALALPLFVLLLHCMEIFVPKQDARWLSEWFQGDDYTKTDLKDVVINLFDSVYLSPLRLRRSASVSFIVWAAFMFLFYPIFGVTGIHKIQMTIHKFSAFLVIGMLLVLLTADIFSDYVSLLVVRKLLDAARSRMITALFTSQAIGAFVVFAVLCISLFISSLGMYLMYPHSSISRFFSDTPLLLLRIMIGKTGMLLVVSLPALLVHLWIPLFVLGGLLTRLLNPIWRTIGWAGRFVQGGAERPFRAIAVVSAVPTVLVLVGSAIFMAIHAAV